MSFKTKLLQRCEYNKCSVPEYITNKSKYGYSSLVSTKEIRINCHDYYSSAIEAEQSAARKALIELNDISRDVNLLLPECNIVYSHQKIYFECFYPIMNYFFHIEILCIFYVLIWVVIYPNIVSSLQDQGVSVRYIILINEIQIKIGNDFTLEINYPTRNIHLSSENLSYDTLVKLQLLSSTSIFDSSGKILKFTKFSIKISP
ncbi:hypothetical protein MXB_3559 [Myxobolus squamalis]|nr:hypothetical protein MXB_3559 [Myxobolus squamalis]